MSAGDAGTARLAAAVRRVLPSVRAGLERLVRIPSVSADPAAAPHLRAHAPWGVQVTVEPGRAVAPYAVRAGGEAYRAARSALAEAWGRPAVDIGIGGSLPFVTAFAESFPGAEILITGVEDPDTRAHAANESLHLAVFERACLAEALLLRNIGGTRPAR